MQREIYGNPYPAGQRPTGLYFGLKLPLRDRLQRGPIQTGKTGGLHQLHFPLTPLGIQPYLHQYLALLITPPGLGRIHRRRRWLTKTRRMADYFHRFSGQRFRHRTGLGYDW